MKPKKCEEDEHHHAHDGPCIAGMELEPLEKQLKYKYISNNYKYKNFSTKEGEHIHWTGNFKYVEMGRN